MKRPLRWAGTVFVLFFCLFLIGKPARVYAEEVNASKIAYVNPSSKRLVVKFKDYSSAKYTYATYSLNSKTGAWTNLGLSSKSYSYTRKSGVVKILANLGSKYVAGTRYKLVVKSAKGGTLTTYYYACGAKNPAMTFKSVKTSTTAKYELKASWTLKSKKYYDGYTLQLSKSADSPYVSASARAAGGSKTSVSIGSDKLSNNKYYYYVVAYKYFNGVFYYGQGFIGSHNYVRKPGTVTGVSASRNADLVTLDWNGASNATSYTIYKSTSANGSYSVVKAGIKTTSYTIYGLSNNKTYYFKVKAVAIAGSTSLAGSPSSAVKVVIPTVAGTASGLRLAMDTKSNFLLKWKAGTNATGYAVYAKDLTSGGSYKMLGTTTGKSYSLGSLTETHNYDVCVRSYRKVNGENHWSTVHSQVVNVTPKSYIAKYGNKMLAANVRTIGYKKTYCVYTRNHYSNAVKKAFVNYKGYKSKTKYLIWISHYTQQCTIYKGSKGKWKIIRTFSVATGKASTPSPRGVFKTTYKETGWYYTSTKELYITHWKSRNSFHTRPLWNSGEVEDATIGKPVSHGCCRCYNSDAYYIYKHIPKGTTVVSY